MNGSRPGTRSAPALSGRRPGTAASNASLPTAAKQSNIKVTVRIRPLHVKKTASAADVDGDSHFASTATLAAQNAGDGFNLPLTLSSHDFFLHQQQVYNKRTVSPIDDQLLVFDPTGPTSHGTPMDQDGPATPHKGRLQLGKKHKNICYGFDRIFPEDVTQHEVYEETAKPLIEGVLDGYNSTVFAYGATGCGKTYTITGTEDQPGVIYRTMEDLFARMRELERERVIEAELSYLEVYNEQIRDLLKDQPPLELREDDKGVQVAKLSKHVLLDVEDVMALLIRGNENRSKAPTEANETSSRSHAVLQIHVKQRDRGSGTQATWKTAILSIIDLAGSERASATKNRGERLREGAKINRSLLALGNCINALCKSVHSRHIPYRDSKLTRLLKFSLGGNCKVVMIANISPHPSYYEETHNTLMYANRAKEIKTKVEQNRVNVEAGVEEYTRIIAELEDQVKHLREQLELARSAGVKGDPSGGKAVYDQVANSRALQFLRDRLLPRSLKQELARESIAAEMALVQRQKALCTSLKESVWGSEYDVDLSQLKGAISQAEKDIERRLQDLGTRLSDALVVLGELDGLANRVVEKADQTFAARDLEDGDQSWTIKVFNDFVSAARWKMRDEVALARQSDLEVLEKHGRRTTDLVLHKFTTVLASGSSIQALPASPTKGPSLIKQELAFTVDEGLAFLQELVAGADERPADLYQRPVVEGAALEELRAEASEVMAYLGEQAFAPVLDPNLFATVLREKTAASDSRAKRPINGPAARSGTIRGPVVFGNSEPSLASQARPVERLGSQRAAAPTTRRVITDIHAGGPIRISSPQRRKERKITPIALARSASAEEPVLNPPLPDSKRALAAVATAVRNSRDREQWERPWRVNSQAAKPAEAPNGAAGPVTSKTRANASPDKLDSSQDRYASIDGAPAPADAGDSRRPRSKTSSPVVASGPGSSGAAPGPPAASQAAAKKVWK